MDPLFGTESLTLPVVAFRLTLGLVAGTIIGFERASRHQSAGVRTHMLIAVGSTLLMLLSIYIPQEFLGAKDGDPGRIAAQVVSGIGFLGAGSILRLGNNIRGLTTAASIWVVAALGLAVGAGMYVPAGISAGLCILALVVLDPLERRIFPAERIKHLIIRYNGKFDYQDKILDLLDQLRIKTQSVDIHTNLKEDESELRYLVGLPAHTNVVELYKSLRHIGKIDSIELKEKF